MTLREKFTESEHLLRELIEHIEHGFIPKVRHLENMVRPTETQPFDESIADSAVHHSVDDLLETDDFSQQLYEKLERYLASIESDVNRIISGE